jgi:superoxide dismutase, Cu-Zn family
VSRGHALTTALAAGLLAAGCAGTVTPTESTARAQLRNAAGQTVGAATFTQAGKGIRVVLEVQGLPPGVKAVHVHAVGRCDPPDFATAGSHFNPQGRQHGAKNPDGPHAGDLPNVSVGADSRGRLESTTELLTLQRAPNSLFDADGSALVVHAAPDDLRTDPTGNSGARIACGVVTRP